MSSAPALEHFVRITARRGRFIEFDYAVGSPDLAVGLVMPEDMFKEFRLRVNPTTFTEEQAQDLDSERAEWCEKIVD